MKNFSDMELLAKFNFIVMLVFRTIFVLAVGVGIWEKNYFIIFVSVICFILTFLARVIEEKYNIDIPAELEILIMIFIIAGLFLGEIYQYYLMFWWWDSMLHFLSGIALALAGFLIMYVFYKSGKLKARLELILLFSFCFALALGALWEITEFSVDSFGGYNMQKARNLQMGINCDTQLGVIDTMEDLILDALGALIISVTGYIYLKRENGIIIHRIIKKFERQNPKLFKKRK